MTTHKRFDTVARNLPPHINQVRIELELKFTQYALLNAKRACKCIDAQNYTSDTGLICQTNEAQLKAIDAELEVLTGFFCEVADLLLDEKQLTA